MSQAALEPTANVRNWNIMASHSDSATHTRDCLFDVGEPEVMEFQFVAEGKRKPEGANVSPPAECTFKGEGFMSIQRLANSPVAGTKAFSQYLRIYGAIAFSLASPRV